MILAMSDIFWQTLIGAVSAIVLAWMQQRTHKLAVSTHDLVNSSFGQQLKLHAVTARSKSDITKDKADIAVAETAEKLLSEYLARQCRSDAADANSREATP